MRTIALLAVLLLSGHVPALAQCGPNSCRLQPAWRHFPDFDPGRLYLFRGRTQLGAYDLREHFYRAFDAERDAWGEPQPSPPVPLPAAHQPGNFGVDRARISTEERITVNGRPVTMAAALELIQGDKIPDDAQLLRLTIIGPDDLRQKVRADLAAHPELARLGARLVIQDYPPEHWAVARAGFFTGGQPTIYLQTPDGKVLHRQDGYAGPDELAAAIRLADPNYDKDRDPDLLKPALLRPETWPLPVWLVLGGAALLFTSRKERP